MAYVPKPFFEEQVQDLFNVAFNVTYDSRNDPVDHDQILEIYPIDEEGAARIAALDSVGKDGTWTICVYMVGLNLEDMDESDLSGLTKMQVQDTLAVRPSRA